MDDLISLKKFQEKLKDLGHFYTPYTSIARIIHVEKKGFMRVTP